MVSRFCDRVLLLEHGDVQTVNTADEVIDLYRERVAV